MPARCHSCGYENRLSAAACGSCGQPLAATATCPGCGSPNPRGQRFCNECGATLNVGASPTVAPGQAAGVTLPASRPTATGVRFITRFGSREEVLVHAVVALIFSMAVVARLYGLASFPDGLMDAEVAVRQAVSAVQDGRYVGLWSEAAGGQPTGFVYWLAGWASLLGDSTAVLRLMSAWLGLVTIGMFYLFCRSALGVRPAVLGSMLLAFSLWHIGYSRLAVPVGSLVLLQLVSTYLLLMALREGDSGSRQLRLLVLAGAAFGATAYTHNAFYIFALAVAVWWARELLAGEYPMGDVLKKSAAFLATALVVALPYLWSLASHADEAGDRVRAIDLSSSAEYREQPGMMERTRYAMGNIVRTGRALLGSADEAGPGRRLLDPATALLAAAGLVAGLWRWREREFFYLWVIVVVSVIVVGLTRDPGTYSRLVVALPAVYAAAGYALDRLLVMIRGRASQTAAYALVGLVIAFVAFYNLRSYHDSPVGPGDTLWARAVPQSGEARGSAGSRKRRERGADPVGHAGKSMTRPTLEIRVQPRAGRNDVTVDGSSRVRVYVTAPPEGGKANAAVRALLADRLGVPRGRVTIVGGERTRDKVIRVEGADRGTVMARLRGLGDRSDAVP